MTSQELKSVLLHEHARDKKLTIIGYVLVLVLVLAVAGILFYVGANLSGVFDGFAELTKGEYGWYFILAFTALIIGFIAYVVSKLMTIKKRPEKIDELLTKMSAGKRAASVDEYVEHKIIIPLGKITFKLCPVAYVMIFIEGELKAYKLPILSGCVPDLKTLLSGVNVAAVNQAWDQLYVEDNAQEESVEVTPIKTVEEFKTYMKEELSESIEEIDKSRKSMKSTMMIFGGFAVLAAIGYVAYMQYTVLSGGADGISITTFLPIIAVFVLIYLGYYIFVRPKHMKAMKSGEMAGVSGTADFSFKTKVFDKIMTFASTNSQYVMHSHIGLAEFLESGMFIEKRYTITGNDLVIGRHSGVPFQFCDLTVSYKKNFSKENEGPDCAFFGQFFVARFNKSFSSPVYIVPRSGKGFYTGNQIGSYTEVSGEKIELEDPDFMKMFNVYGADQIEARYILTPSLMERIKELAIRTKGQFYISFYNNKISVANNNGKNNFEVKMSKSLTKNDNDLIVGFYQDICDQFAIIDDLKLNIKIWKKK